MTKQFNTDDLLKVIAFYDVYVALRNVAKEKYKTEIDHYTMHDLDRFVVGFVYEDENGEEQEVEMVRAELYDFIRKDPHFCFTNPLVVDWFFEIEIMLCNSMNLMFSDYNYEGWSITFQGVKENKSDRLIRWYEIAQKITDKEIRCYTIEEIEKEFKEF